jgi:hypothetical protein
MHAIGAALIVTQPEMKLPNRIGAYAGTAMILLSFPGLHTTQDWPYTIYSPRLIPSACYFTASETDLALRRRAVT